MAASYTILISGSEDGHVYIWDVVGTKILAKLPHPGTKYVHSVATHPSRNALLSVAGERVFVWTSDEEFEDT